MAVIAPTKTNMEWNCEEKNGVIVEINGSKQCVKNEFKLIEVKK